MHVFLHHFCWFLLFKRVCGDTFTSVGAGLAPSLHLWVEHLWSYLPIHQLQLGATTPPHPAPRGDGWWCRMGLGWGCSGRFFLERLSCCGDKLEAIWKSKSITAHCQASLIASLSAFNCNELYGSARWGAEPLGWNLCNSRKCLHKSQVNVKLPTDFSIHEPLFVFGFRDRQRKSRACVCLCELHELKDTKRKKDRELSLERVLQWPDSFP